LGQENLHLRTQNKKFLAIRNSSMFLYLTRLFTDWVHFVIPLSKILFITRPVIKIATLSG
jgi:hypothetical protein